MWCMNTEGHRPIDKQAQHLFTILETVNDIAAYVCDHLLTVAAPAPNFVAKVGAILDEEGYPVAGTHAESAAPAPKRNFIPLTGK